MSTYGNTVLLEYAMTYMLTSSRYLAINSRLSFTMPRCQSRENVIHMYTILSSTLVTV